MIKSSYRNTKKENIEMKKKIYVSIIGFLVFTLFLTTALIVNHYYPLATSEATWLFMLSQGISLLILLFAIGFLLIRKRKTPRFSIVVITTLCIQLLPWGIYGFVSGNKPHIILSSVTIFLAVIIYTLVLMLDDIFKSRDSR